MGNEIIQPSVSLSLVSASLSVSNAEQKILVVGQMGAAGTATDAALVPNIGNSGEENALFQRDSHLAEMIRSIKRVAPQVQVDAIALDDPGGTAAAYTITLTGGASESGTIALVAGSEKNHKTSAIITSGETITASAVKIAAAINADLDAPFTAVAAIGVITLTAVNDGTVGNSMPVGAVPSGAFAGTIAGLTVAVAQSVTGSGDPTDLGTSAIFDVVGNTRYQGVVCPYVSSAGMVSAWLDTRFNVNNRIVDGVAFVPYTNTFSSIETAALALNSKSLVIFADEATGVATGETQYEGPAMPESPHVTVAAFAALRALRLTTDASLSQYLTTTASRDQFGGAALATLPYFNSTIPSLPITRTGAGFTDLEIESLITAGAAVLGQNSAGTGNLVGEVPTTYKTDAAVNADISWKFLNYVDTMSQVREYYFNNYKSRFAQSRLTEGIVLRGRDMVNRAVFEAYTDQLYGDLSGSDFVLLQAGQVAVDFFKANRTVVLDLALGKVTVTMLVPIVTQTRQIIGTIQIAFSTEES